MTEKFNNGERPKFPKRAVVTAGMPYGNKTLHFGHIGGVFVPADVYARFLRDRIGKENVIFVSGTDCYGSPIAEGYRLQHEKGLFQGTIEDYVRDNHRKQKAALDRYEVDLNLYGASGLAATKDVHAVVTDKFIRRLYDNGWLDKMTTRQFYDTKAGCFLNGRQVVGKCPIENCSSEKAYADECELGHQYMPEDLINPRSTLTGEVPEMRNVDNWYFRLTAFYELLDKYVDRLQTKDNVRPLVSVTMRETLIKPIIYIRKEGLERYQEIKASLPKHQADTENIKNSFIVTFDTLTDREKACAILTANQLRFRTGKTLVPLRLTGNIEWGVPAPELEGIKDLTVWVWPESLWAPISFTIAYLLEQGISAEHWKDYWCSKDCEVFQFIGQDNIYFYGIAQMAMFMATQGQGNLSTDPAEGELTLSTLVANHHILFLDKKASSSGSIKPPMAEDLLDYYTAEQLRCHFLGLALDQKSVSFQPKPLNPTANPNEQDPVLKEGNLFTNVLNRLVRSCFYTAQKYHDGFLPYGTVDQDIRDEARKTIVEYEQAMYKTDLHNITNILDTYIRLANKYWVRNITAAEKEDNAELRTQTLINSFYIIRVACLLAHPIVPKGTEMVLDYLMLDERFWSWDHVFADLYFFCADPEHHQLKFLEPKIDFFEKHPSQFAEAGKQ
ncbi:MAG: class I tRNA ligase family protein [Erysipelotrichaceae bacterium]|nr:class I tRNA ligase family protein [Erysipelotrichaceae bacterium]